MHVLIALIVVVLVLVAWSWWYTNYRFGTTVVSMRDGEHGLFGCNVTDMVEVISATYTRPDGSSTNVADGLQRILNARKGFDFTVDSAALGQSAGGTLTFRYKCATAIPSSKAGFLVFPMTPCPVNDAEYGVDMSSPTAAGNVAWYWPR